MNFSTLFHILNSLDAKSRQVCGDYSLSPPTFSLKYIQHQCKVQTPVPGFAKFESCSKNTVHVHVRAHNLGVRHVQGKNYKKFKKQKDYKSTSQKIKKVKPF